MYHLKITYNNSYSYDIKSDSFEFIIDLIKACEKNHISYNINLSK